MLSDLPVTSQLKGKCLYYYEEFLKQPSKWCILKGVLTYSLAYGEETNA